MSRPPQLEQALVQTVQVDSMSWQSYESRAPEMCRRGHTAVAGAPQEVESRSIPQGYDAATAVADSALAGFNLLEFRALILQWVIADNIAFKKADTPHLGRPIQYANPRTQIPSHTSISRWIAKAYDQKLEVVTKRLASAITRLSLSFDLWTPGTSVALLGIVAHIGVAGSSAIFGRLTNATWLLEIESTFAIHDSQNGPGFSIYTYALVPIDHCRVTTVNHDHVVQRNRPSREFCRNDFGDTA